MRVLNRRSLPAVPWPLVFLFGLVLVPSAPLLQGADGPPLLTSRTPDGFVQVAWPEAYAAFALETSPVLGPEARWTPLSSTPAPEGLLRVILLEPADSTRFLRLRALALSGIAATSPASGESGVAVTRETIVRFEQPLAPVAEVTTERFYAEFGGRRILSRTELSADRRTATLFYLENLPASARVRVRFEGTGLYDFWGNELDADGDGMPGGAAEFSFLTAGITAPPGTAVIGRVFDSEPNPDGSNRPLVNVTITVDGAEETLRATTDASGFFRLDPSPAGRFFVHIDGRTATDSAYPQGAYYPFIGKAWQATPGRTDNLAAGTGEIFLPLIQAEALQPVSVVETTTVRFAASVLAANPDLADVSLTVPPNALFSDNGTRGGRVGIAPVPPDRRVNRALAKPTWTNWNGVTTR